MTLDEAIKHCEEVAEYNENELSHIDVYNAELAGDASRCVERATDHRQLAEWLKELKQWRRVYGVCPSYEMCIPECREGYNAQMAEAKKLLKAAVEDFAKMDYHIYDCDRECYACPLSGERDHCLKWRYADEAFELIDKRI